MIRLFIRNKKNFVQAVFSSVLSDMNASAHQNGFQRKQLLNFSDNWPVFKACNLGRP